MATIAENIQTLRSIKSDIKQAITNKGGSVGNDFKTYAQAITNLPSGGGGGNEDLIDLIEGKTETLTIPEGTTTIGSNVFQNYTKPKSVIIPDSVTMINMNAFDGCTSLTDVTIGSGVKKISYYAFQNCSSLTSITILATKPPMLNSGAFDNTNNCHIYVPVENVLDYKRGSGSWPSYIDRIFGIGEIANQPDVDHGGGIEGGGIEGGGDTDVPIE